MKSRDAGKLTIHFKLAAPDSTLPTMPLVEDKPSRARHRCYTYGKDLPSGFPGIPMGSSGWHRLESISFSYRSP